MLYIALAIVAVMIVSVASAKASARQPHVARGWYAVQKRSEILYEELVDGRWHSTRIPLRFQSASPHVGTYVITIPKKARSAEDRIVLRLKSAFAEPGFRYEKEA